HGVEDGPAFVGRPALPGRDASDDLRPIGGRLLGVKRSFPAGEALDDQPGVPVDEYGHYYFPRATTFSAASLMVSAVVKFKPLSRSICLPCSPFAPSIRPTT